MLPKNDSQTIVYEFRLKRCPSVSTTAEQIDVKTVAQGDVIMVCGRTSARTALESVLMAALGRCVKSALRGTVCMAAKSQGVQSVGRVGANMEMTSITVPNAKRESVFMGT